MASSDGKGFEPHGLPPDVQVFERGWLSSNNVLLHAEGCSTLIDSGYITHETQTSALVRSALKGEPLHQLLNTHLHSDHCGGNRLLQSDYPAMSTLVPIGSIHAVRRWDERTLSFEITGQRCEQFSASGTLQPGSALVIGGRAWQVHAAPGHDPEAVLLFSPEDRILISADALWENGFGVVFPELEGEHAFEEVEQTLDLIESLDPLIVIPGHGSVFGDSRSALARARSRLAAFVADPRRHAAYAAKVLLKFKLLEVQRIPLLQLETWTRQTPYFELVHQLHFAGTPFDTWVHGLLQALSTSGAATRVNGDVFNSEPH